MKKNKKKKWPIVLCMILFVLCVLSGIYAYCRIRFPLKYEELVTKYATEYQLDPYFVFAVIWTESSFRSNVQSHAGAIGLMQIMPSTGEWIAEKIGLDEFNQEMLLDPEINIRFGCWYLAYLSRLFEGNEVKILAGYNAGPNNVKNWQEDWGEGHLPDAEDVPYSETEEYIKRVNNAKKIYEWLY